MFFIKHPVQYKVNEKAAFGKTLLSASLSGKNRVVGEYQLTQLHSPLTLVIAKYKILPQVKPLILQQ